MKKYYCWDCQCFWDVDYQQEEPLECPKCGSEDIVELVEGVEE